MKLKIEKRIWPLNQSFNISRGSKKEAVTIELKLMHEGNVGRGECVPYSRYNETAESVLKQFEYVKHDLENNKINNHNLHDFIKSGSARNALDCALYDLHFNTKLCSSWDFFSIPKPQRIKTCYTVVLNNVKKMTQDAKKHSNYPILKVKVDENNLEAALQEIRNVAPNPKIILDANEDFSIKSLEKFFDLLVKMKVSLMEQPVESSNDADLEYIDSPIPLCADESFHDYGDIKTIFKKYDYINVKLDKTGGLTEALRIAKKTKEIDKGIMIGCMVGSSLSMLPALMLYQYADYIDLDGPCFLQEDQKNGLIYDQGFIKFPEKTCWG